MHIRLVFAQWGESKFPNTSAILYIEEATPHTPLFASNIKKTALFWKNHFKLSTAYDLKIYVSIFSNECCWF